MRTAPPPPAPGDAPGGGGTRSIHREIELHVSTDLPAELAGVVADWAERVASQLATGVDSSSFESLRRVLDRVHGRVLSAAASGDQLFLDRLVEQLDALATPVAPANERWNELVGPFYDTAGLARWLGLTRQRLSQRVHSGDLLGLLPTSKSTTYFPVWQFAPDGDVVRGVPDVIRGLGERSAFNKALWFKSPREEFGNHTAIEVLANGDPSDVRTIIEEARADGAAWAR